MSRSTMPKMLPIVSGTVRNSILVGNSPYDCGAVTVEAGTTVSVGDFVYNGGIVHLGSTATATGAMKVTGRFVAQKKPIRVRFDATVGPGDRTVVLSVPVSSGLSSADFSFSGLGDRMRLLSETKDGFLMLNTKLTPIWGEDESGVTEISSLNSMVRTVEIPFKVLS